MNLLLIFSSVFLNCIAQILIRKGMLSAHGLSITNLASFFTEYFFNFWLWGAFSCYAISLILWMIVLSKVEVSYAYPLSSFGYVIATILGYFFLQENINALRILGITVICTGVYIISRS